MSLLNQPAIERKNMKLPFEKIENMKYLGKGFYLVRNQAGFRKAYKRAYSEELSDKNPDFKLKNLASPGMCPKEYPAIVQMGYIYSGHELPDISCIPVSKLLKQLTVTEIYGDLK